MLSKPSYTLVPSQATSIHLQDFVFEESTPDEEMVATFLACKQFLTASGVETVTYPSLSDIIRLRNFIK